MLDDMENLLLTRADGWPQKTGRWVMALAALPLLGSLIWPGEEFWLLLFTGWFLIAGFGLLSWRRVTELRPGELRRWWGWQPGHRPLRFRELERRSIEGLDRLRVERLEPGQHYKKWKVPMYRVILENAENPLKRVVLDDEHRTAEAAGKQAEQAATLLGLPVCYA